MGKTKNEEALAIQYKMLRYSGGWPRENPTTLYKLYGFLVILTAVGLAVTMSIEVVHNITDFARLSETLYIMITVTTYIFKHVNLFVQTKTFVRMVKILNDPILGSYPDDLDHLMVRRVKISRLLTNVYRYMVFLDVFLAIISPAFNRKPLPFPFPYDVGKYRAEMYVLEAVGLFVTGWNNPTIDSLTVVLMGIAATQLEILGNKIRRVRSENFRSAEDDGEFSHAKDRVVVRQLKECIRHHLTIIEYVECVDKVFSFGLLMQFLGGAIIICNTLFHFVLVSPTSFQFFYLVNYILIILTELFMYCWFGHDIIWKSLKVSELCYTLNWYNCGNVVRKYLFIMMERSRRSLTVTVFRFSALSLNTFVTILQWSYSYFALLLKMYNKKK